MFATTIFTQQVASPTRSDLYALVELPEPLSPAPAWTRELATAQLTAAGFTIVAGASGVDRTVFADVGALVWYLLHLPWVMPEFTVETIWPRLEQLHAEASAGRVLTTAMPLFWLQAHKPLPPDPL